MNELERFKLAKEVYEVVLECTETFNEYNIGSLLAYLMGGILTNRAMDFYSDENNDQVFIKLLYENFPAHSRIWDFTVLHDDERVLNEEQLEQLLAGHNPFLNEKSDWWECLTGG